MNTAISRTRRPLAPQQTKVLVLIAKGYTNNEIMASLSIARATVTTHIRDIGMKTGIKSRVLLGYYALAHGIVTQDEIREAIQRDRKSTRDEMLWSN